MIRKIPDRLIPGDTIGILAPASPFDIKKFNQGIASLETMGFRPVFSDDIFERDGYFAGSDIHRANLLNRLFGDRAIKAVICARGGYGSARILSLLDFELIMNNPKIFIGFSDITALLSVLNTKCGLVTFHGPMVTTLGNADSETKEAVFLAFTSRRKPEITARRGGVIIPGTASGPVSGGNLSTLCHLVGTPFEPDFSGHILFIEERGEVPYRIDRMLTHMRLAGCFKRIEGLVLGSFEDCGMLNEIYRMIGNIFKDMNIPILGGFGIGHGKRNITIPVGLPATLDTDCHTLSFHEPPTLKSL